MERPYFLDLMKDEEEELEIFAEGLRTRESRELATELSKAYTRLKTLDEEEKLSPEGSEERERVLDEQDLVRRKIGAVEEEIGRRKKNNSWPW